MPANPIVVTVSSAGVSRACNIDWMANLATTAAFTVSASGSATDFTLQYTLDDLQRSSSPVWFSVSSAPGSSAQHFSNTTTFDNGGIVVPFSYPIAGLRLSSTTLSSAAQSITLRILQGAGGD